MVVEGLEVGVGVVGVVIEEEEVEVEMTQEVETGIVHRKFNFCVLHLFTILNS